MTIRFLFCSALVFSACNSRHGDSRLEAEKRSGDLCADPVLAAHFAEIGKYFTANEVWPTYLSKQVIWGLMKRDQDGVVVGNVDLAELKKTEPTFAACPKNATISATTTRQIPPINGDYEAYGYEKAVTDEKSKHMLGKLAKAIKRPATVINRPLGSEEAATPLTEDFKEENFTLPEFYGAILFHEAFHIAQIEYLFANPKNRFGKHGVSEFFANKTWRGSFSRELALWKPLAHRLRKLSAAEAKAVGREIVENRVKAGQEAEAGDQWETYGVSERDEGTARYVEFEMSMSTN